MAKSNTVCSYPACSCRATGVYCSSKPPDKKKKKGITRQTSAAKKKAVDKSLLVQTDAAFYLEIWQTRPHVCFETGKSINQFSLLIFHHVLEKNPNKVHTHSDFSRYRHCRWNIVVLNWDAHTMADNGLAPKVKEYRDRLVKLHDEGLLQNVSPNKDYIE